MVSKSLFTAPWGSWNQCSGCLSSAPKGIRQRVYLQAQLLSGGALRHVSSQDTDAETAAGQSTMSESCNIVRRVRRSSRKSEGATEVNSSKVPKYGSAAHAMVTPHAVYVSGLIPMKADGTLKKATMTKKTRNIFENMHHILWKAHSSMSWIMKVQVFLKSSKNYDEMDEEYQRWMTHRPARTCVMVRQLPLNADIMIDCIALPGVTKEQSAKEQWIENESASRNMAPSDFSAANDFLTEINELSAVPIDGKTDNSSSNDPERDPA